MRTCALAADASAEGAAVVASRHVLQLQLPRCDGLVCSMVDVVSAGLNLL